jgi:ABC-type multidrug transport system permease subunit
VELTRARLLEFAREPEALFWTFIFPIVISVTLAAAFPGGSNRPVRVGLVDNGSARAARAALGSDRGITVVDIEPDQALGAIREGEVHIIVVPGDPPAYRFDPARDESRLARLAVDAALKRAAGRAEPWTAREEPLVVPGSRYIDWLIPGILGMNIMSTGMWGVGFSIAQARLRKLLKLLAASPMRKSQYLLAQMMARLMFLLPEATVPLAFGALALGMPIIGSFGSIAVVCLAGALAFTALGLLTASRASTIEAISGILNLTMLPMWVVSGVFFSTANFPEIVQPLIQALPLTALNDALRAVILEGATLIDVRQELGLLAAWAVVPFGIALRLFRWR